MKRDCVVLFSGGIDSYIHLCWAEQQFDVVKALYVDFEHRYAERELAACGVLLRHHPNVEFITARLPLGAFERPNGFIPSRNMYLLQLAANYSDSIVFGTLHNESAPDHRRPFIVRLEKLIRTQYAPSEYSSGGKIVRVLMPFDCSKSDLVRWYLRTVSPMDDRLRETTACYCARANCGRCRSCLNRWVAFQNNYLRQEDYDNSPYHWAAYKAKAYRERVYNGDRPSLGYVLKVWWYNRNYLVELRTAFQLFLEGHVKISSSQASFSRAHKTASGYILGTAAK